jgi:glyoxylase-like metal-dependent hydrolase (beta-lactamase superfamily II)
MSDFQIHRFAIGNIRCRAINDGDHTYAPPTFPPPAVFLFADAPKEELGTALEAHGLSAAAWKEWKSPYTCLLIEAGDEKVLVDTGAGGFIPGTGQLRGALEAEGVATTDIGTVIVTHGHPDHVGGCLDGDGRPMFDNARYVLSEREHRFWTSDECERVIDEHMRDVLVGTARRNLGPIADRLELVSGETSIVDGVRVIPAYGHTPGHLVVEVASEDETLLFLSDTVLHPIQLGCPHFCGVVDIEPAEVAATRRAMLARAAEKECLVMAFHFPFPGLGRVVRAGEHWEFRPVPHPTHSTQ